MAPTSIGSLDSPLGSVDGEVDHFSLGQGRWISWAILSLAVSLFFCFWNLGYSSYHAEDESLHVSVIQQMIHHDHLVVPHDEDGPYFNKPPLKMWATIPVVSLFGETPFSFRFLDGLAGVVCGFLIFLIACSLFNSPRAGFFATVFFFTADIVLFDHGVRSAVQDSWLLAFSISVMWIGYHFIISRTLLNTNHIPMIAVGAVTGLSLMVKSAAGVLAPVLLGVVWLFHGARRISFGAIFLATTCAAAPALIYGAVLFFHHPSEMLIALNREVLSRITDGFQRQNEPFFYFTLIGRRKLAIDGSWLLISTGLMGYFAWKRRFPHAIFLSVWAFGPLILFSAVKTRLEWYILPAIPAHALITGWALDLVIAHASRFAVARSDAPSSFRTHPVLALVTLIALSFGVKVFFTDVSRSIRCIMAPPAPVALDKTARQILHEIGAQSTVVYPEIKTLIPGLFERNHLRSLSGGNVVIASSPDELVNLFGGEPEKHPLAITRPEVALQLIASGRVHAYRSLPPLIRFPRQHQRRHWLVLLSAKPVSDGSFQTITTSQSIPTQGGTVTLPASSFITKMLGMSITIRRQGLANEPSPLSLAVRIYSEKGSSGGPLSCQEDAEAVKCSLSPELVSQARPSVIAIEPVGSNTSERPLLATVTIGTQQGK